MDSYADCTGGVGAARGALTLPGLSESRQVPERGSAELPAELVNRRVLVVHDWITTWAGSERCLEQILELFPQADLVVGLIGPRMRDFNEVTRRARETWLAWVPGARTHHRWFVPLEAIAFATLDARGYDLIISSSHAFAKAVRRDAKAVHVCYCYTPPRYLWDLNEAHRLAASALQGIALGAGSGLLRRVDRWSAQGVDHFVAISQFVADRIRRCYGREATVVYPPVRAKGDPGEPQHRQDFALYLGRLVPYKRVDLAIEACRRMGLRLIVGGDGPDRKRLERLADGAVEFLGHVSESEAGRLLSMCRLFIFCAQEDFGIAPLEANAHGAPVVYYARGGVAETMVPGRTGVPFYRLEPSAVADAMRTALEVTWVPSALVNNGDRFSARRFRDEFAQLVRACLAGGPPEEKSQEA